MPRVYRATPLHPYFHDHVGSIPSRSRAPTPEPSGGPCGCSSDGGVVGIFPEGPFSRHGTLVRGQPGVALVALRAGVPVVPAAISGTFHALAARRWFIPRPVPLSVRFGKPLRFTTAAAPGDAGDTGRRDRADHGGDRRAAATSRPRPFGAAR